MFVESSLTFKKLPSVALVSLDANLNSAPFKFVVSSESFLSIKISPVLTSDGGVGTFSMPVVESLSNSIFASFLIKFSKSEAIFPFTVVLKETEIFTISLFAASLAIPADVKEMITFSLVPAPAAA